MPNNTHAEREKIAARLKQARILAGLSQAQAADKLDVLRPTISEIESGRRKVSADELIQFAEMYKVDTAWLLHEEVDEDYKFAARELSKLSKGDREKIFEIIKLFPKEKSQ